MDWMRNNMKAIIWLAVAAFGLTIFAGWGMGILGGLGQERILGTVAGEQVEMEEYLRELRRVREEHEGPVDEETRINQRRKAFDKIVERVLIRQLLEREGGEARSEEIRQWFMSRPEFRTETGQFDAQSYQQFLERITPARRRELEEAEKDRIETMRFYGWLQDKVDLSDTEAEQLIETGFREVKLYGIFIDPTTYIDEERVRDYYETRERDFEAPPRAFLRQIFFEAPEAEGDQRRQQLEQLRRRVEHIKRRVSDEDDFSDLAREYSQDTETVEQGGMLGWVEREQLSSPQASAVFRTEPGNISELARAEDGYYLYYVRELEIDEKKPLDEVRDQIENALLADTHWQQAKQSAREAYDSLRARQDVLGAVREKAVEYHGQAAQMRGDYGWLPVKFVYLLSEEDRPVYSGELSDGFAMDPAISAVLSGLRAGDLSEPFVSEYGYHIFYCGEQRAGKTELLTADDRQQLRQFLIQEKTADFIEDWLKWRRARAEIKLEVEPERVGKVRNE
ncbi:MAG: peptidylprolyl isomerase [bacterium]